MFTLVAVFCGAEEVVVVLELLPRPPDELELPEVFAEEDEDDEDDSDEDSVDEPEDVFDEDEVDESDWPVRMPFSVLASRAASALRR